MGRNAGILDRNISKGKHEISLSTFALLFAEIVRYAQNRAGSATELHDKLAAMGRSVGSRLVDVVHLREKGYKREVRLLGILMFMKTSVWKALFGREADKLERSNDDARVYLLIEREPLVNTFVSIPRDKASLNCAAFQAGVLEAMLCAVGLGCKVAAHWHNGTAYVIEFDDSVIQREKDPLGDAR